jgi:hypothetical protein
LRWLVLMVVVHPWFSVVALSSGPDSQPRPDLSDARGVTGPEPVPAAPTPFWRDERAWAVVIVIIAVAAAVLAGRRRKQQIAELPDVWAAAEMDRLTRTDPGSPQSADALDGLLREFLDRRYRIAAKGKTTAELVILIGRSLPGQVAEWQSLLESCDVARFANVGFSTEEWSAAIQRSRRLIAASLPVGETAGTAATGPVGENA